MDGRLDVRGERLPCFGYRGIPLRLDGFVPRFVVVRVADVDCEGWRGEPSESDYDHRHDECLTMRIFPAPRLWIWSVYNVGNTGDGEHVYIVK